MWKVTNVGAIGGKSDIENRIKAAKTENEWKNAGKAEGVQVWRVENFGVKEWPKPRYGQFFAGDAYIVLYTYGHIKSLRWDVHFWLGTECTVDEQGTAALKTIELDDLLGTFPVQYRETQGHESAKFMKLFPKGIRYLKGGIDSGFRHVDRDKVPDPRLFHIKGRKYCRCVEVPLKAASLNNGDGFILDTGKKVLIWIPTKANPNEKFKCAQVAQEIRNSRRGKLPEERLDEGGNAEFWKLLGGKPSKIADESDVQSDVDFDDEVGGKFAKVMFKLSDESGKMQFSKIEEVGKDALLSWKGLDTMDVFVLDAGAECIAWIGKKASPDERKKAILYASSLVGMQKKPIWTRVIRVEEGREGPRFKGLFKDPPK